MKKQILFSLENATIQRTRDWNSLESMLKDGWRVVTSASGSYDIVYVLEKEVDE